MAKRILIIVAWLHIIGGMALPFLIQLPIVAEFVREQLANTPAADGAVFWMGVFGPTVASWGVLFLMQLKSYFADPISTTWNMLIAAVLVWIILDTVYCLLMGVPHVLMTNIPAGLLLLLPLWFERPKPE